MKPVLVATDLSPSSKRAVARGLRVAAGLALPCHVIFVIDEALPGNMVACLLKDSEYRLDQLVAEYRRADQSVEVAAPVGDPFAVISAAAERTDPELLVLGMHRARPFIDLLSETTMERLVRHAHRPVLLVQEPPDTDYRKVLIPVDFSLAGAEAIRLARRLAPDAALRSFHAVHTPFSGLTGDTPNSPAAQAVRAEASARLDAWIAENQLCDALPEIEIVSGRRTETMMGLLSWQPDLIAVGAHRRDAISPSRLGSFVADLIRTPPCDILVAHAPE